MDSQGKDQTLERHFACALLVPRWAVAVTKAEGGIVSVSSPPACGAESACSSLPASFWTSSVPPLCLSLCRWKVRATPLTG